MNKFRTFGMLLSLFFVTASAFANNVRIENVSIVDQNTTLNQYTIQFDLLWDNSWRISEGPSNWDAAWVFLKFSQSNLKDWEQGLMLRVSDDPAADGHIYPSSAEMQIPLDRVGAFFYRAEDGNGDTVFQQIQIIWDYDGEDLDDDQTVNINLHAIEMVNIPEGPFYLGDNSETHDVFQVASLGIPFFVDSEDEEITLGGASSANLTNGLFSNPEYDDFSEATTRTLPAEWPMGYHAMYVMKYETTNGMYNEFYNSLNETQQEAMKPDCDLSTDGFGGFIQIENPYRPIDCVTWGQVAAFLDWSGLRPLSETEYEKACRGPLYPEPDEYAWGTSNWFGPSDFNDLITENDGEVNEIVVGGFSETYPNGVSPTAPWHGNSPTVLRVGIFAASVQNPTRINTGASYYGLMEMTGNAPEAVIGLGSSNTRDYSGLHGNGEVTSSGNASTNLLSNWSFVNASGVRLRGYNHQSVSRRFSVVGQLDQIGFRGCRTAP